MVDRKFWKDRKVFVTGHTGFKGSWLCLMLQELGADIKGFSLPLSDENKLFRLLNLDKSVRSKFDDIRNFDVLESEIINFSGSIVPFKMVSKFISVVPAVGELLTGSNKKGFISGQFKLNGKVSDPDIDINILSFSPGILRQIFSKDWLKQSKD